VHDKAIADLTDRGVDLVRVLWSDLHGIARGKDLTIDELPSAIEHGVGFCQAVMLTGLDATPLETAETSGTGWPDAFARPDVDTLAVADHTPGVAICLADIQDSRTGGPLFLSPRDLLRAQVARLTARDLHPIVGPELEFSLCRPDKEAPNGWRAYLDRDTAGYIVGVANDPAEVIPLLLRRCRAMGIPVYAGNHEFSGGQFEINIRHADAVAAADRAFLFKHATKEIAAQQGLRATFMGKPFADRAGNGTHLHLSIVDSENRSAFYDPADEHGLSTVAQSFLAGLIEHAPALTAILNPTVNAFKRLGGGLAPAVANWGPDNRAAYIRLPPERGPGTRLEIRIGDGTTNPYLAIAALLAAGLDGIDRGLRPPPLVTRDDPTAGAPLPTSLGGALTALEDDKPLVEALGPRLTDLFVALKRQETRRFAAAVTDWEFREYSWLL
jgi:glutamine synthetase